MSYDGLWGPEMPVVSTGWMPDAVAREVSGPPPDRYVDVVYQRTNTSELWRATAVR